MTNLRRQRAGGAAYLLIVFLFAPLLGAQIGPGPVAKARQALELLLAAHFPEFSQTLTANAKTKLTPEFLRDNVAPELKGFGSPEQVGEPVTQKMGAETVVSFPVRFTNITVNVEFALNDLGHVAGLYFRPVGDPPAGWKRPPYSNPARFHDVEVTVGTDPWKLGGTLTLPLGTGPFPTLVLVHGPGPNDRNEAIFGTRMFEDIAEGLASRGYAVLRYDKRTKVHGEEMGGIAFTIQQETVEDALSAIALLRKRSEVDPRRIYLLGHSLGGYIAPRIALKDARLAGIIVAAGNARRIEDISVAQTEFLLNAKGGPTAEERQRFDRMKEEAALVRNLQPDKPGAPILLGLPVEYFLDLKTYDPVAEARRTGLPLLFLHGERDFQVTAADVKLWQAGLAGGRAQFRTYPALNHLLIAGEGDPSPAEYRKPGNVAPEVIAEIAGWLAAQKLPAQKQSK